MSLLTPPAPSSILALATTAHLALTALGNYRRRARGVSAGWTAITAALAIAPWVLPSWEGLAAGLLIHGVCFAIAEQVGKGRPASRTSAAGGHGGRPRAGTRGFVPAAVLDVRNETADIRTFRFMRPSGFAFAAGQFLAIRASIDGRDHVRCYSISSAPDAAGYLEISVKRQGIVSSALHATLRPGVVAHVKTPAGAFTYPAHDDRPLLLIAGGVGITPLISMMRHSAIRNDGRSIVLLYSAPAQADFSFRGEIERLTGLHPRMRAVLAVTRETPTDPRLHHGRIDAALITSVMPEPRRAIAMMCGPQPMIDGMRETLSTLGLAPADIRFEVFEAVAAVTRRADTEAPHSMAGAIAHAMRCVRSEVTLRIHPGQTLLEAIEDGGVAIDSLCRSGVCGTCRTRVVEGDVECASAMLDAADRRDGFVLACVSHALGNCAIEA